MSATHSPDGHTRVTGKTTQGGIDDVIDKAQETTEEALRQGQEFADKAHAAASDAYTDLEAHIRRNPLQSALAAAGVGFVLALLMRR